MERRRVLAAISAAMLVPAVLGVAQAADQLQTRDRTRDPEADQDKDQIRDRDRLRQTDPPTTATPDRDQLRDQLQDRDQLRDPTSSATACTSSDPGPANPANMDSALSLQSAIKLAGIPGEIPLEKQNANGRKVTEVSEQITSEYLARVEDIRQRIQLMPLKWAAKDITPLWSAEKLSLVGYSPTSRWELKPATDKQVKTIQGFRFQPQRDLTRGEASALIDKLLTLEAEEPEMATEKQAKYLAWKGLARYAEARKMTKREAKRLISRGR